MSTERVLMLCGPPGSGKTTLGQAFSATCDARFVEASSVVKEIYRVEGAPGEEYLEYVDRVFASRDPVRFAREIADRCVEGTTTVVVAGLRLVQEVALMRERFPSSLVVFLECDAALRRQRKPIVDPMVGLPVSVRDAIEERWQSDDVRDVADAVLDTERSIDVCVAELAALMERRLEP
jgi:dephospho-CoA kinase